MLDFVQGLASGVSQTGAFSSPLAAAYWTYHLTRMGLLAVQGLSGMHEHQDMPATRTVTVHWLQLVPY